jgi:hypothetical protein
MYLILKLKLGNLNHTSSGSPVHSVRHKIKLSVPLCGGVVIFTISGGGYADKSNEYCMQQDT